ncbi:MAG TPA: hypothetical protein VF912_05125 [Anaeromyxobacter sp.]
MEIAGRLLGAGAPRWQRLEAICQEWLGAHPGELREEEAAEADRRGGPVADWLEAAKESLEREMNRWDFLEEVPAVAAPVDSDLDSNLDLAVDSVHPERPSTSPPVAGGYAPDERSESKRDPDPESGHPERSAAGRRRGVEGLLEARLRELAAMRDQWDLLLGHLAMLMKNTGLWRDAGFAE